MPNSPQGQARVERLIGTITTEVFQNAVGYSKVEKWFDPFKPSDSDAKRSPSRLKYEPFRNEVPVTALLKLEDLDAKLLAWAITYNRRPHRALPVSSPNMVRLFEQARQDDASQSEAA
jgi:hypothetical protein